MQAEIILPQQPRGAREEWFYRERCIHLIHYLYKVFFVNLISHHPG